MSNHEFRVLTGFDNSPEAAQALRLAFDQAGVHPLSSVHVVRILPGYDPISDAAIASWGQSTPSLNATSNDHSKLKADVRREFLSWSKDRPNQIGRIDVHTRTSTAAAGIVDLAEELDVDLIVVGTHGRKGLRRFLFGSVADTVIREATCPVLVAHLEETGHVPQIEPPCPQCLEVRFASYGRTMWCVRHSEHHVFGHKVTHASRPLQPQIGTM